MINVIKYNEKNKADMDEYSTKVIFDLFPVIRSRIFEAGSVTDDYWDQVHNKISIAILSWGQLHWKNEKNSF